MEQEKWRQEAVSSEKEDVGHSSEHWDIIKIMCQKHKASTQEVNRLCLSPSLPGSLERSEFSFFLFFPNMCGGPWLPWAESGYPSSSSL